MTTNNRYGLDYIDPRTMGNSANRNIPHVKVIKNPLKPCLRCGNIDIEIHPWFDVLDGSETAYRCACGNGHYWDEWLNTIEDAVNAWNERPL
jgi:hypothetical protein